MAFLFLLISSDSLIFHSLAFCLWHSMQFPHFIGTSNTLSSFNLGMFPLFFMNNGSVGDYVTISGIIRDFVYRDGLNHGTSLQPTYRDWETKTKTDRKSTRLNSSHRSLSRMPSSA